ncbi:MAG: FadR/GntR family transcriptional regulator, partial [Thermodesulfobacteriota bacterium]
CHMSKVISLNDPSENKIFQTIGNKRLFQRVVDQIRIAVFKGELRPGNKLPSEDKLVSMLGVSRSAVREAIKVLESAGMLVVQRGYGGGTFVRDRDITSIALAYADLLRLSIVDGCI